METIRAERLCLNWKKSVRLYQWPSPSCHYDWFVLEA